MNAKLMLCKFVISTCLTRHNRRLHLLHLQMLPQLSPEIFSRASTYCNNIDMLQLRVTQLTEMQSTTHQPHHKHLFTATHLDH
jgi:hypothetical protein